MLRRWIRGRRLGGRWLERWRLRARLLAGWLRCNGRGTWLRRGRRRIARNGLLLCLRKTNLLRDPGWKEVCLPLRPRCLWQTGPLGPVVLSSLERRELSRAVPAEAVRFGPYWGQIEQEGPAAVAARCPSEQLSGPLRPRTTAHARPPPCFGKPWVADCPGLPAALPVQI